MLGRWPGVIAGTLLLATLVLVAQATKLSFDTSFESFLSEDHPTRVALDRFRDQFGRGEPVVVAVRLPGRVADPVFLERLRSLHDDLEERVLHLERITSLVNVRATRAVGDELEIGELLAEWPSSAQELDALERFVRASPLYQNYLIGQPPRTADAPAGAGPEPAPEWTAIVLEARTVASSQAARDDLATAHDGFDDVLGFESDDSGPSAPPRRLDSRDDIDMLTSVRAVLAEHRARGLEIHLAGSLVVGEVVGSAIRSDFVRLLLYAVGVIAALLYVVFRRLAVAALLLGVVGISLAGCLGAMALADSPIGFGTQILPTFLLAAGVGYGVHVVTLFRHALEQSQRQAQLDDPGRSGAVPTRSARADAIEQALDHAGAPIALTALTTMGGLLSFVPTDLAPLVQLGAFAPIGIALAALYCLTLLPALLVLLPLRFASGAEGTRGSERRVVALGMWAAERPRAVGLALAFVIAISLIGISRLETRHDPLGWLPESAPVFGATKRVDAELGGASVLELNIEAHEVGGFRQPALLRELDAIEREIRALDASPIVVGKVSGLHDVVKELNQSLHGDRPEAYRIPEDPELIAQELILFESSGMDDVERIADASYTNVRLSVRVNQKDAFFAIPFAERVRALTTERLAARARVDLTGLYELKNKVFVSVISSLKKSYAVAFVVIGLLMVAMIGDLRIGLVSVIPNAAPIVVAMGLMGWLGIPLGVYTLLVGSIAMGLAVDDTIHMAHGYVRFEREGRAPRDAMRGALSTAGVAVLFTSAALIGGFLVFGLASLSALLHFGVVTAAAIAAALVADLVVSPALFVWVSERRDRRAIRHGRRVDGLGVRAGSPRDAPSTG